MPSGVVRQEHPGELGGVLRRWSEQPGAERVDPADPLDGVQTPVGPTLRPADQIPVSTYLDQPVRLHDDPPLAPAAGGSLSQLHRIGLAAGVGQGQQHPVR
jgi:hypothetical protein